MCRMIVAQDRMSQSRGCRIGQGVRHVQNRMQEVVAQVVRARECEVRSMLFREGFEQDSDDVSMLVSMLSSPDQFRK